jgi:hypothetical protein
MNFNHKKMRTRNFLGALAPFLLLATIPVSLALVQDGPAKSVTLPSIFADHMVLQQGRPIKVWGQAQPASKVSVTFKGLSATTTAADDGGWEVVLPPFAADKAPADLRIAADTTVVLKDVLVGEVWLCSGQSNMAFPLKSERSFSGEKARADDPSIRFYDMEPVVVTEDRPFSLEEIAKITPRPITAARPLCLETLHGREPRELRRLAGNGGSGSSSSPREHPSCKAMWRALTRPIGYSFMKSKISA